MNHLAREFPALVGNLHTLFVCCIIIDGAFTVNVRLNCYKALSFVNHYYCTGSPSLFIMFGFTEVAGGGEGL